MRKRKTTTRIKRGMLELLKTKSFMEITVTDLANAAGVARASFYRAYRNIDDVLVDMLSDYRTILSKDLIPQLLGNDKAKALEAIADFYDSVKEKSVPLSVIRLDNRNMMISRLDLASLSFNVEGLNPMQSRYLVPLAVSVLFNFAIIWAKYGFEESSKELASYTYNFIWRD